MRTRELIETVTALGIWSRIIQSVRDLSTVFALNNNYRFIVYHSSGKIGWYRKDLFPEKCSLDEVLEDPNISSEVKQKILYNLNLLRA